MNNFKEAYNNRMKNLFISKNYFNSLIYISFFLMLIFPTRFQLFRATPLAIIGLYSLIKIRSFIPKLYSTIFNLTIICLFNIIISIAISIYNQNIGLVPMLSTNLIWPLFFTWLIACNKKIDILDNLQKIFIFGFIINSILLLFFISLASNFILIDSIRKLFDFRFDIVNFAGFNIISMGSFIFGFGYFFSRVYIFSFSTYISNKEKILNLLCLFLSIALLIFSGRGGFWLGAIASIIFTVFSTHFTNIRRLNINIWKTPQIYFISLIVLIFLFYNYDFSGFIDNFTKNFIYAFQWSEPSNIAQYKRFIDFQQLIQRWQSSPIFGVGIGFTITEASVERVQDIGVELQYVQYLAAVGIFGISIFIFYLSWIIKSLISISNLDNFYSYRLLPLAAGMISMLSANATNPYLAKFDYFWIIFLPLSYINLIFMNQKSYIKL